MSERDLVMQQFYIENELVEYCLTYHEACILMNLLASKLPDACAEGKGITILLALSQSNENSSVNPGILTRKVRTTIEMSVESADNLKPRYCDCDDLYLVECYFEI